MTQPEYVSTTITPAGRDALRRMAASMTGHIGQRVSMSDALRIAERLVHAHYTEVPTIAVDLGITPGADQ